jgi:hypothetical protein
MSEAVMTSKWVALVILSFTYITMVSAPQTVSQLD